MEIYEQLMLEMINRARANPGAEASRLGTSLNQGLQLDPPTILNTPKPPLAFHPLLMEAARGHSRWMLDTDTFSHTGINGSTPKHRMESAGYVFQGSWTLGENIGWGGTTGIPDMTEFTIARHDNLFLSPPHRVNICNPAYDEIGLGILDGQFTTDRTWNAVMATQKFARSEWTPGPLLTGVIFDDAGGDGFYDPGEGIAGVTITPEGGDWYAISSTSGGYAVPYTGSSGSLIVTISGGAFSKPRTFTIERTGLNVKLDVDFSNVSDALFVAGSMAFSPVLGFQAEVAGRMGKTFHLEHSTDLENWQTVETFTFTDSTELIVHRPDEMGGGHFYRLRLATP
jgi:hypothetical protein